MNTFLARLSVVLLLVFFAFSCLSKAADEEQSVLIVTTSHDILGETGYPTGAWISEITHPYDVLTKSGIEVDIASVAGGRVPLDPYSDPFSVISINTEDEISKAFLNDEKTNALLENSMSLKSVEYDEYDAVIFAGGNGALWDFYGNPVITAAAEYFWNSGKVLSALCHGSAALLQAKSETGEIIIEGKEVTGFCNEEELIVQSQVGVEYQPYYLEDELVKAGGLYKRGPVFESFVVVDGRLVTGQQNFSGHEVGEAVLKILQSNMQN